MWGNALLDVAAEERASGWIVKGSADTPFPEDGPDCKYTALCAQRPCFDALRRSFLVPATQEERETVCRALFDAVDEASSSNNTAER